ncbi:MAG: hypothetical protein NZM06_00890 [Chloroherpetonaceae bacterium]|nr:hypothetical protein [Chloroherpetonaceae bacterium]MDW8437155.1 hypothetical protein [Chloroherpetonaceae bacterium]
MNKLERLERLRPYCHQDIRGVLIEILLEEKVDLYERLEIVVSQTLEAHRSKLLAGYDWDVGESRWRNAYLVHLWSDEIDLDRFEDFDRHYSAEELDELLGFLDLLKAAIAEELADVDGWEILPR